MAISPDGMRVACGLKDGQHVILDAKSLGPIRSVDVHAQSILAMAFSPEGRHLATGGEDAEIAFWDVRSGRELLRFGTPGARDLLTLCYTPDGRRILSASRHVSIGIWEAQSGMELVRLHGHEDCVHDLALSLDGRILASASGGNTVRLWDARPLEERDRVLAAERAVRSKMEKLFNELGTIERVMEAIHADPSIGPLEKYAACLPFPFPGRML
jgi:WD40 repeat protein